MPTIEWDVRTNTYRRGGRDAMPTPRARQVTNYLNGFESLSFMDIIGQEERARLPPNAVHVIGAHHIPHSVIVDAVVAWLNGDWRLPQLCAFIGGLLLPPPSYCLCLTLNVHMGLDGLKSSLHLLNLISSIILKNPGEPMIVIEASALADTLSHVHTNLRLGDEATNSSIGALIDPRIARNRGLDPVAWMETLYQLVKSDPRPRLAAESIYAASLITFVPGYAGQGGLPWDWPAEGNQRDLRSSVDGSFVVRVTPAGNSIRGVRRQILLLLAPDRLAVYENPFRRAAYIPILQIPAPVSWSTLMIIGMFALIYFTSCRGLFQFLDSSENPMDL